MNYANIPVMPPPPGVKSNFEHPDTLAASLIAVNATFLSLMLITVVIRFYVRSHIVRTLGWDDYTCAIAALGSVVHTILMLWDIHYGYGTHLWDIRLITLLPSHLQKIEALAILYPIVIFFVKLSISLLVIRLFGVRKTTRYMAYFGIVFCFLFYAAWMGTQIGTAFLCNSRTSMLISLCRNGDVLVVISGVINVVTDFYLLALPISPIMQLQLRRQQKVGLLAILMAGLIACLVSLARLVFAWVRLHDADALYNAALTTELTSVELNIGIITASMSAMPQFFKSSVFKISTYSSLRSRLFSDRNRSKSAVSKRLKGGDSFNQDRPELRDDRYFELQHVSHFHACAGGKLEEGDGESKKGILRTTQYDVSLAPKPEHPRL